MLKQYTLEKVENDGNLSGVNFINHPNVIFENNLSSISFYKDNQIYNQYPNPEYKELLIQKLSKTLSCDQFKFLITHGSDSALKLIVDTFLNIDSKVFMPIPTYTHMEHFIKTISDHIYEPYVSDIESLMIELKSVGDYDFAYLVFPSTPFGIEITDAIYDVIEKNSNTLFIIDFAYDYILNGHEENFIINKKYLNADNVIYVRTFSKEFGLAQLRLGYCFTSEYLYNFMKVFYNDKMVIDSTVNVGINILNNLPFYNKHVALFKKIRNDSKQILSKIVSKDDTLYDVTIKDNCMWFLLYSKHCEFVFKTLLKNGITIRLKNNEIKDCMRINYGNEALMTKLYGILKNINFKTTLSQYNNIYVDLDDTLRDGVHFNSKIFLETKDLLKLLIEKNNILLTDSTSDKIELFLNKHKIHIFSKIIRSLDLLNEELKDPKYNPYYIGSRKKSKNSLDKFNCVVITNGFYNICQKEMLTIMYILQKHPLFYVDDCKYTAYNKCPEISSKSINKVFNNRKIEAFDVPDVLAYVSLLNPKYSRSFSKKTYILDQKIEGIMIGDSKTDKLFANNNGLVFLNISIIHEYLKK